MKKVLLLLAISLAGNLVKAQALYHYDLLLNFDNRTEVATNKELISELRAFGLSMYNVISHEEVINFDSPQLIDSIRVNNILKSYNNTTLSEFSRSKSTSTIVDQEKQGGVNCTNAFNICSDATFSANSSGYGTQELNSSNRGCLISNEHQSSWYYLYIQTGGTLTMLIDPHNNNDDYDFAIWGPYSATNSTNICAQRGTPIRCNYSADRDLTGLKVGNNYPTSASASENTYSRALNVSAGEVYILLVDNYSNSGKPYTISWGGTSQLGCQTILLGAEVTSFKAVNALSYNQISWQTENEQNNDYFVVEKSIDGFNWTAIATEKGAINSRDMIEYYVVDKAVSSPTNYYRLTSYDVDGTKYEHGITVVQSEITSTNYTSYSLLGEPIDEQNYSGVIIRVFSDGSSQKIYK